MSICLAVGAPDILQTDQRYSYNTLLMEIRSRWLNLF